MLITTPEELRAFLPSHTYRNLDTVRGYLQHSELTFLCQRIGKPLLAELNARYAQLGPIVGLPIGTEGSVEHEQAILTDPWPSLIILCQRCIAFDGMYRSAGIRRVSDNDMGLNVAESDNFAAVDKDRFAEYKIDLYKNAHAASDLLLSQLQEWEGEVAAAEQQEPDDGDPDNSSEPSPHSSLTQIVSLWRQSPTYPLTDGLLFTTATEFNKYVSIQQSLDKFVELLPDIRYCQELHLEAEIGPDLLAYLHQGHRAGTLTPEEKKAYQMLQRTLSLYVEARAKMFARKPDARDEACGYMALTKKYIADHGICIPPTDAAPDDAQQGDNSSLLTPHSSLIEGYHNPTHHHGIIAPPQPSCNGRPHSPSECGGTVNSEECGVRSEEYGSGFLTTSMI